MLKVNYSIEKSKDDYNVLKIEIDSKKLYLDRKYNMKDEINKFLKQFENATGETIFIICGFAAGEHIKALRNKFRENIIIVFEPICDLKDYIENLYWVKNDEKIIVLDGNKEQISEAYIRHINVFNYKNVVISVYGRYNEVFGQSIQEFLENTKAYFVNTILSHNTRMMESRQWFKTLMENLEYMISGTPINEYKDCFSGKPAIIISAGPSLDKNIDQLKDINDEFVLFTGYRNIDGLLSKGITPTFLSVIDASDALYELGKKSIPCTENIPLLFFEKTNDLIVKEHRGKKIFFTKNKMIKKIAGIDIVDISMGGSVAHSITDAAMVMGCNPIIFVGQDLAYTNNKNYSQTSGNKDGSWTYDEVKRNDDVWVEAYGGGKVKTSLPLQVFIKNFESIIYYNKEFTFINATEGGARIHGTIEMTLKEALEKYKNGHINFNPAFEKNIFNMKERSIEHLKDVREKCIKIKSSCKKALRFIEKLKSLDEIKNSAEINGYFRKLNKVDENIKENYDDGSIIESLLYPVISEILGNKINNNLYKDIVDENDKLYSGILKQVEFAIEYIMKIEERLINK